MLFQKVGTILKHQFSTKLKSDLGSQIHQNVVFQLGKELGIFEKFWNDCVDLGHCMY